MASVWTYSWLTKEYIPGNILWLKLELVMKENAMCLKFFDILLT